MTNKTKTIIGLAAVGVAGYLLWKNYNKKTVSVAGGPGINRRCRACIDRCLIMGGTSVNRCRYETCRTVCATQSTQM
jgi:hypothetical protein